MTRAQKISRWLLVLAPVLLVLISIPHLTYGQGWGITDFAFSAISKVILLISYFISWLASIVVALIAWLVGILLFINTQIANSPPVKIGFPITLAFANLCFVLAIIVIAVATIVRFNSYGVKQTLWRLVVITILVNFGLVIANSIIGFSDSLAMYFLNGVKPGGTSVAPDGSQAAMSFASALGGSFSPQKLSVSKIGTTGSDVEGAVNKFDGTALAGLMQASASLAFSIAGSLIIVLTLGALLVMLMIRYVKMGYLLIVLPVAWAGFIFPHTKRYWSSWWDSFLKNVFFTPIVLFFLWLTMQIAYQMNASGDAYFKSITYDNKDANSPARAIDDTVGQIAGPLLNAVVLMGLMLGGLIAAQNFGFGIAGTAKGLALGAAYGVGRWSKRVGTKAGTWPARKVSQTDAYKNLATKMQAPGGWLKTRTIGKVGGLMQRGQVATAGANIAEAERKMAGMNTDQILNYVHRTKEGSAEQVLALKKIADAGKVSQLLDAEKYFKQAASGTTPTLNQAAFKKLGLESDWKKARNESGLAGVENLDNLGGLVGGKTLTDFAKGIQKGSAENQASFFKDHDPKNQIFDMDAARQKGTRDTIARSIISGEFTGTNRSALFREVCKSPEQIANMRTSMQGALRAVVPSAAGKSKIEDVTRELINYANNPVNAGNAKAQDAKRLAEWLNKTPAAEMGAHQLFLAP